MNNQGKYQVLLLPGRKVVVPSCSLREAVAWISSYNAIHATESRRAVIADIPPRQSVA